MARQFHADLSAWVVKAQGNVDLVVRKVVLDIGTSIVMRSPVGNPSKWKSVMAGKAPPKGYIGGRFRANWQHGTGSIPEGTIEAVDKSGALSIGRIMKSLSQGTAAGKIHYLTNNLPYAIPLERGHSKQAPAGMVTLAVIEFQGVVQAAALSVHQ